MKFSNQKGLTFLRRKKAKLLLKLHFAKSANRGFTLIELILYIAIVTIVLSSLVPFTLQVIGSASKANTQQEVFSQARFISERIKYEIRNASGINSVAATSISLGNSVAGQNPTVIDLSGGNIRIKQGAGATINLNSNDVTITSLTFTDNTSGDNKTKNISFVFTLTDNFSSTGQEYSDTTTIRGSAEVRSN